VDLINLLIILIMDLYETIYPYKDEC